MPTHPRLPTTAYLRKYYHYDPAGDLIRKTSSRAGKSAITVQGSTLMVRVTTTGTVIPAARLIMKLHDENFLDHYEVGFKDGNHFNLTLGNLFILDNFQDLTAKRLDEKAPPPSPPEKSDKSRARLLPPLESLKEVFRYNSRTGQLQWRKKQKAGAPSQTGQIGKPNKLGYRKVHAFGQGMFVHRVVWKMHYGQDPGENLVDHINGDPSDNRIKNLRLVSHRGNARNRQKLPKSGFRNVSVLNTGMFVARMQVKGRVHYIGTFPTPEQASEAVANVEKAIDFAMDVPKQDYPEYMI